MAMYLAIQNAVLMEYSWRLWTDMWSATEITTRAPARNNRWTDVRSAGRISTGGDKAFFVCGKEWPGKK